MTLEIKIPADTESLLRERASAVGQDVETYILQAVAEKLNNSASESGQSIAAGDDWNQMLRTCIELHPIVPHVMDDSRDSIYADRGE